jgi:hypothetical protein
MILSASRKLGKYEIVRKLGRGGMADVYLARDPESNRDVALKLVEHIADSETRDVIEAERRGAGLQHELAIVDSRVVRVYESGDIDGFFYVAMEYIDGQDLAELMRGGPLAVEFACDCAIAVAETLDHAHNLETVSDGRHFQGIVHGDIKPKNIRIDSHGNVRVLDFGIAKALSMSRRLTRNEFGSVPYASPERLDSGEVNAASDIWSLSVMLYEMVTGMQPYHAESTERLERMIRSRIPPPPAPDPCPVPVRRILMKALANDPAVRFRTARDLANELILFRTGGFATTATVPPGIAPTTVGVPYFPDDETRRTTRPSAPVPDDETRRTTRPAAPEQPAAASAAVPVGANDETRRTVRQPAGVPIPDASIPAAPDVQPSPGQKFGKPRNGKVFPVFARAVALLAMVFFMYGACSVRNYFSRRGEALNLERQIKSEQLTDPDEVYSKWSELAKTDPTSWSLSSARHAVENNLVSNANLIVTRFRNDTQVIYERDWRRAQTLLSHALAVNPDDETARGELRLAEGHIARFEGTRHKDSDQLTVAAEKFTEAAKLLPNSPDPYLGLALLYIYGLKDVDKAGAAIDQARRLGYKVGSRENAELADGYRDRGDRLFWDSRNVRGLPQEKDQISHAAEDYARALALYQQSAPYGNAANNIKRVQNSLDSVTTRLQEIQNGGN